MLRCFRQTRWVDVLYNNYNMNNMQFFSQSNLVEK